MSTASQGSLPKQESIKRKINRIRNVVSQAPPCPTDRRSIVIPNSYATYESEHGVVESFILGDSLPDDPPASDKRVLIFGRESARDWIHLVNKIHVDGTFSISPSLFAQVFLILAKRNGFVVPLCYGLLPTKEEIISEKMVRLLQKKNFRP